MEELGDSVTGVGGTVLTKEPGSSLGGVGGIGCLTDSLRLMEGASLGWEGFGG